MQLAIFNLGGWALIALLALVVVLLITSRFRDLNEGLRRGMEEFLKATREVETEIQDALAPGEPGQKKKSRNGFGPLYGLILWLAQGFGAGRIPFAPGTFGSIVGLGWFALLLMTGDGALYAIGALTGIALSVFVCGAGERILKQKDPGSIVMDEIVAIPICFAGWVGIIFLKDGYLPGPEYFFSRQRWLLTLAIFALFRLFDVAKPWPVRQSQELPGGWGVTVDDVLAAVYVNLVLLLAWGARWLAN